MINLKILGCLLIPILLCSCAPNQEETAIKGHLFVLVSESVAPVLGHEVGRFMSLYQARGADVAYAVVRSRDANVRFVNDSIRCIITTIPLTANEKDRVKKTTDHFVEIVLAYDGVIAVVQNRNSCKDLSLKQIREILSGRITKWEQLGNSGSLRGTIRLILEDSSDVLTYLSQRLLDGGESKANFRQTHSSEETLEEISKEPRALGFVALNTSDTLNTKLRIVPLAADSILADTTFRPPAESIGTAYTPHPAHIYLNYYPMKRAVYVYSKTTPGDFATGFTAFLASPEGQKIFLENGLVPGTQKIILKRPGQ
jgi:phosphate transport system substrate-binding protein